MDSHHLDLARRLVSLLERLSADSYYAHVASGVRGALLRGIERSEAGEFTPSKLDTLVESGFSILEKAARER